MLRRTLLAATCLSLGLLAAPAASFAQAPATVRVGLDVDAGTLDPRLARDTSAYRVTDLIYDGLVRLSPDLKPMPNLATKWENPDPLTWIFTLREGVTFHDGSPFTADDVVFTYQTLLKPEMNAPLRALFTPIAKVEAVDAKTVKFTLSAPYSPLLSYLEMGIVPKKAVEGGADIGLKPVGTGPMKLASWNRGSKITLAANAGYWGGAPKTQELQLVVIGDNTARAQAFEAKDLDLIQSPLSPQDIKRLQANAAYGNAVTSGLGITYLNFNVGDPAVSDPALRRALAMLVDQKSIVGDLYRGVDQEASSILLPSSWAYSASIKQPTYNPAEAAKALDALGWKDSNGDGIRDKGGKKLQVTISTHNEDPNRVQTLEFMQAAFQQAGVEAQIRITDWPAFSTGYVQKSQHQVALLGWLNIVDPDRLMYGQFITNGPLNWSKYSNAEVDQLLETGRKSLDLEARKAAYQKAATIIANELPYYVLSYQGYQVFYAKSLGALEVNPRGYLRNVLGMAAK
ncbi:ABC transporter substrate-binding protein [uncultured Alsobacter sp.]|uniref:ABC transporter substrate-binding protein n=1 Tax=uncultured Alsobacter sp. TaxID=1748258 RepID=UPI0025DE3726|nr:ABC transporter substrate-binding protein [uncultured Alsobacter sp.]